MLLQLVSVSMSMHGQHAAQLPISRDGRVLLLFSSPTDAHRCIGWTWTSTRTTAGPCGACRMPLQPRVARKKRGALHHALLSRSYKQVAVLSAAATILRGDCATLNHMCADARGSLTCCLSLVQQQTLQSCRRVERTQLAAAWQHADVKLTSSCPQFGKF